LSIKGLLKRKGPCKTNSLQAKTRHARFFVETAPDCAVETLFITL